MRLSHEGAAHFSSQHRERTGSKAPERSATPWGTGAEVRLQYGPRTGHQPACRPALREEGIFEVQSGMR